MACASFIGQKSSKATSASSKQKISKASSASSNQKILKATSASSNQKISKATSASSNQKSSKATSASSNLKILKATSASSNQKISKAASVSSNQKMSKGTSASSNRKMSNATSALSNLKHLKDTRCLGYFHCWVCNNSWRSEHVFCHSETRQVKYRQKCKRCQTFYKPYRTEAIPCVQCHSLKGQCLCTIPDFPGAIQAHKRDLCERCLSCSGWCDQGEDGATEEDAYDSDYDEDDDDGASGNDLYGYGDSVDNWSNDEDMYDDD